MTNNWRPTELSSPLPKEIEAEMKAWLSVSGDVDDFIYYGQDQKMHSEK